MIYVAGNPDAYPLEYYDSAAGTYEGVIPRLLESFSAQSGYQLAYYAPGEKDQRESLAKNLQVDLLSGYADSGSIPAGAEELLLFQTAFQGEETSYYLGVTAAAPERLGADLTAFLSAVSQEEISGILMETAARPDAPGALTLALGGAALILGILAAAAALIAGRFRKKLKETRRALEYDQETGLGNLNSLRRYYRQMVNDKNRILYSMLYFRLDTDSLRRQAGNREAESVLRFCAIVLEEHITQTDLLVRAAEDGFALLRLAGDQERIKAWADPVLRKIRSYPEEHGKPFSVEIGVGAYPLAMDCRDLDEIIFNAAQVAQRALEDKADCRFFTHALQSRIRMEEQLRSTVAKALDGNEFQLYVQFYVNARTSRIVGGEALSRWLHPERGLLLPGDFVPALEREGLIYKLDYHCLRSSCAFLQALYQRGIRDFFLSCNFSRETFAAPDFVERCREIIDPCDFNRGQLIFELTESVSTNNYIPIRNNMQALRQYGVRSALDDFGEGFTSFADLQEYPVDGIKLDKGLVDHILTKKTNSILRAMVQIGHEMGLTILAEGVETDAQAQALREIHCDVIQGFRFYAPIPQAEAMEKLLRQHRDTPALER